MRVWVSHRCSGGGRSLPWSLDLSCATLAPVTQRSETWIVDPDDPRAPPADVWERMTPEQRARVVESLPSEFPLNEAFPPEGDRHWNPQVSARRTLERYFARSGRSGYVGAGLPVYYPAQRMF